MADGEVRFTMRLDPDTDQKWDEFQEEQPGLNSKSELVRQSVSQFIQREEDREDGELTREQKKIVDTIRMENSRLFSLSEEIQEVAERLEENQVTPSQHRELSYEAVAEANQQQTSTILTQLSDFNGGDNNE